MQFVTVDKLTLPQELYYWVNTLVHTRDENWIQEETELGSKGRDKQ